MFEIGKGMAMWKVWGMENTSIILEPEMTAEGLHTILMYLAPQVFTQNREMKAVEASLQL